MYETSSFGSCGSLRRRSRRQRGGDVEPPEAGVLIEARHPDVLRGRAHDVEYLRGVERRPHAPDPVGGGRDHGRREARAVELVVVVRRVERRRNRDPDALARRRQVDVRRAGREERRHAVRVDGADGQDMGEAGRVLGRVPVLAAVPRGGDDEGARGLRDRDHPVDQRVPDLGAEAEVDDALADVDRRVETADDVARRDPESRMGSRPRSRGSPADRRRRRRGCSSARLQPRRLRSRAPRSGRTCSAG